MVAVMWSQCFAAARRIATRLRSTSSSVVAHEETLMRMAVRPCHTEPPHQQVPSRWTSSMTRLVVSGSPNEDQDLVEHHLVEDLEAVVA